MYLNSTEKLVIALIGFFGLVGTAFILARPIAISANSYFKQFNEKMFPFFFTAQIIVPFILGTALIELYFLPDPDFNIMWFWGPMAVLIFIIYKLLDMSEKLMFEEDVKKIEISKGMVYTAAIIYFGFRLVLSHEFFILWSKF